MFHRSLARLTRHLSQLRLWFALLLGALALQPALATGINGLWTSPNGDYTVFLQDSTSGQTFALQVPATLDTLRVWQGTGSASAISLANLLQPADTLAATVAGEAMSGSIVLAGMPQPFSASLALGWVATEYAGVWQKASPANAYLVFCVLNAGGTRLALQIDVTITGEKTYAYDIFTGTLNGKQFTGVSLTGSGLTSRLDFADSQTLAGSTTTLGRPPQTTTFSATHIIKLAN